MVRGHQYLTPSRRYALVLLLVVAVAGWMPLPSWGQVASKFFRVKYNTWFLQLSNPCTGVPLLPTDPCWLRRIVLGNSTSTSAYYAGIGATNDTFNAFKSRNGFNTGGDVQAVYFNEGDLRLGRDMHCKQNGPKIACYVSNYGPPPFIPGKPGSDMPGKPNLAWPNTQVALDEAINGAAGRGPTPFATVAMEFSPTPRITFATVRETDGANSTGLRQDPSDCFGVGEFVPPGGYPPIPGVDVDTNLDIEPGDLVTFAVTGSIWAGFCFHGNTGPNGFGNPSSIYPLPGVVPYSVIGRVGATGPYFFIGDGSVPPTPRPFSTGGRLFLRTNDDLPGNGSGAFSVTIIVNRQNVKFYIYDGAGALQPVAALDQEGEKFVPQMCMSCHGGTYNLVANRVTGASFLPFEPTNFIFSQSPLFTRSAQEDKLRQLNLLVAGTNPNPVNPSNPITEMINVMYGGLVSQQGKAAGTSAVPGWKAASSSNPPLTRADHERLYNEFVKPYCRTCHAALKQNIDFGTYEQLKNNPQLDYLLCKTSEMPHAQVTYEKLRDQRFDDYMAQELRDLGLSCLAGGPGGYRIIITP